MSTHYTAINLHSVVTGIGECVRVELATTPAGEPDRVCLSVPGQIAWDACDCGQLALSVGQVYGSVVFPTPADGGSESACGTPLVVAPITVSITRCVPGPDDLGNPPSCDELLAAALILEQDRYAVRRAVACCLRDMLDSQVIDYTVGASVTVGPEGLCAGSDTAVLVAFTNCDCPG